MGSVTALEQVDRMLTLRLVADAAQLLTDFTKHALELVAHVVHLALRLGSGASKADQIAALHWR